MTRVIRFGDWCWDPNTLELRNGTHVAALEPRVARLFEFFVAHRGELLSHDRLVEAVWDGRVVSDDAVRRAVFALRQALSRDGSDACIRTIHKKGYVADFPLQPVPDDAPGTTASRPASGPDAAEPAQLPVQPPADPMGNRWRVAMLACLSFAILLVIAALVGSRALWPPTQDSAPVDTARRAPIPIAVLPFANLSEEPNSDYLSEGLAEELLGTLARTRELQVTARSSAFQFRGEPRDVREVGRRLGVRYVLEGSVRKSADRVRIQVNLIDALSGMQLWAQAYDRTLADLFALQQEIATEVARTLELVLLQRDPAALAVRATPSVEAHLGLLRARQLLSSWAVADAELAIEHLQRALALDPGYPATYALLADAIVVKATSTNGIGEVRSVVAPLLEKALALDPGLGEAYALRSLLTDDTAVALRDLQRGLALSPSFARGYELLANLQIESLQNLDEAVDSIDRAIALDPLTPNHYHVKADIRQSQGDYAAAAELERHALKLNPNFRAGIALLSQLTAIEGEFAQAIDYGERAVALDPQAVWLRDQLTVVYLALGDKERARAVNNPPTQIGRLLLLAADGNWREGAGQVYGGKQPDGWLYPVLATQLLLRQGLADGDIGRARSRLAEAMLPGGSMPPGVVGWDLYAYANLAQILRASGEVDAAARLEEQIEQRMVDIESRYARWANLHDQVRAVHLAVAGRGEDACAALERTYAKAPRMLWWLVLDNPAFDGMRSLPRLRAVQAKIDAHLEAERARVAVLRVTGRVPERLVPAHVVES